MSVCSWKYLIFPSVQVTLLPGRHLVCWTFLTITWLKRELVHHPVWYHNLWRYRRTRKYPGNTRTPRPRVPKGRKRVAKNKNPRGARALRILPSSSSRRGRYEIKNSLIFTRRRNFVYYACAVRIAVREIMVVISNRRKVLNALSAWIGENIIFWLWRLEFGSSPNASERFMQINK